MSLPDYAASATLGDAIVKPVFFAWLDFVGDPVRANTSGADITVSFPADPDLDGHSFTGVGGELVDISSVKFSQGGSESVTAQLSGISGLDDEMLSLIDDPANWRGREARLWRMIRNAANVQQGGFQAYYTGRMTALKHSGSPSGQQIQVTIEAYLAALSQASNRTYLDQAKYDSGDLSAQASIAIANGNFTGALTPGSYSGSTGSLYSAWQGIGANRQ